MAAACELCRKSPATAALPSPAYQRTDEYESKGTRSVEDDALKSIRRFTIRSSLQWSVRRGYVTEWRNCINSKCPDDNRCTQYASLVAPVSRESQRHGYPVVGTCTQRRHQPGKRRALDTAARVGTKHARVHPFVRQQHNLALQMGCSKTAQVVSPEHARSHATRPASHQDSMLSTAALMRR